jgi:outer membrane protein assembly factor BamB
MKAVLIVCFVALACAAIFLFFRPVAPHETWVKLLPGIGTYSSPRVEDINHDGVKDIILGAGKAEFQHSDSAMFALDGQTGKLIWANSAIDQIFGSAGLYDINGDGVKDVFLAGRSVEFKALDGKSGKTIWAFDSTFYPKKNERWFNFYNPQFIHDVDKDGLADILISNGGDIKVPPYNTNRAAGRLVIMSSANGKVLAEAGMPDNREIYMSVAINPDKKHPEMSKIIFGTGGETVGGNLYVGNIQMVLDGDLSKATKLAEGLKKGFIAPPAWVDINRDGQLDIICNSVDGRIMAFDGTSFSPIWSTTIPRTEAYTSMAVGKFNADPIPDFFITFAKGRWPNLTHTKQAMISGKNGKVEFLDSLGYYQTSSPVVADMDEDGMDEVLLSVDFDIVEGQKKVFRNAIFTLDFEDHQLKQLTDGQPGHNIASTPWVGDLNDDGYLDIIYCHGTNKNDSFSFDGLEVHRIETKISIEEPVKWGSYMGSNYDGVFEAKEWAGPSDQ